MRPRPSSRWNASYLHRRNAARPLRRRLPKPSTTVHGRIEILLTGTPRPARGCARTTARHPGNGSLTTAGVKAALMTVGHDRGGASASKQPTWARHLTRRSAADASRREPRFTPWREGRHQRARSCPTSGRGFGVPPPLAARHLKSLAGTPGSSLSGTATVAAPRQPPPTLEARTHTALRRARTATAHRLGTRPGPTENRFRYCARTTISLQDGVRRSVRNSEILFVDALPCVGQANARAHQWPARPARHAAPRHGQYPAGAGSGPRRGWRRRCRAPGGRGMEQISAGSKLSGANSRN
jgi:hypothetical protein